MEQISQDKLWVHFTFAVLFSKCQSCNQKRLKCWGITRSFDLVRHSWAVDAEGRELSYVFWKSDERSPVISAR